MVRSIFSAAILTVAVAGVTGCTSSAHFAREPDATGTAIVAVPQSDWCQWYYKHEALDYIRSNYPSFKERDILYAGEVPVGQLLDGRKYGPDGKPVEMTKNGEKEYQIVFRLPPKPTVTTINGVTSVQGLNTPAPMNGVVMPTSGVQNLNSMPTSGVQNLNSMPPTGQQSYNTVSPNMQPSMGGPAMPGYQGSSYGGR